MFSLLNPHARQRQDACIETWKDSGMGTVSPLLEDVAEILGKWVRGVIDAAEFDVSDESEGGLSSEVVEWEKGTRAVRDIELDPPPPFDDHVS